MNLQQVHHQIIEMMSIFLYQIKASTAMGKTDINTTAENVLIPLFVELYGYRDLKNLNFAEGPNFPAIDLGDKVARVAFQVTATPDGTKVKETLKMFTKREQYKDYDRLIVYILNEKQGTYEGTGYDQIIQGRFIFDKDKDIWDFNDVLREVASLQIERAVKIQQILEANFAQRSVRWSDRQNNVIAQARYLKDLVAELERYEGVSEYIEPSLWAENVSEQSLASGSPSAKIKAPGHDLLAAPFVDTTSNVHPRQSAQQLQSVDEALNLLQRFTLLGESGIGKSTILRCAAYAAARRRLADPSSAPLPLLLDLAHWMSGQSVYDFIRDAQLPIADLFGSLERGDIVLYLDGFNEMGRQANEKVRALNEWLHGKDAPRSLIIACRQTSYTAMPPLNLPVVSVGRLSDAQVALLAKNYLGDKVQGFLDRVLPKSAEDRSNERHLIELARNPYLLVVFAEIFRVAPGDELPNNTGMLFEKLVTSLWERERVRHTPGWTTISNMKDEFSRLAFAMIDGNMSTSVPVAFASKYVRSEGLLSAGHEAGILRLQDADVRFSHQLMQEFFAALRLSEVGLRHALGKRPSDNQVVFKHILKYLFHKDAWIPKRLRSSRYEDSPKKRVNAFKDFGMRWYEPVVALTGFMPNKADDLVREALALRHHFLAAYCIVKGGNASDGVRAETIDHLLRVLRGSSRDLRHDAATALGLLADKSATRELLKALKTKDEYVGQAVVQALIYIGEEGVPDIVQALNDSNSAERAVAAIALGYVRSEASVPGLVEALTGNYWHGQWYAAWSLGRIGGEAALNTLMISLQVKTLPVRLAIIVALGDVGDGRAVPTLLSLLENDNSHVRGAATHALGNIGDPVAVANLRNLLSDYGAVTLPPAGINYRVCDVAESAIKSIESAAARRTASER